MVHRDLTFSALSTVKHAIMVYRSRPTQTLYVSTPFLPGANSPTATQTLLGQMISAYQDALIRCGSATCGRGGKGGGKGGRGGKEDQGENRHRVGRHGGGGAPSKRKGHEPDPGSGKKAHKDTDSDGDIPVAVVTATEQPAVAKVSPSPDPFLNA
jgi:hypothetical protein